MVNNFTIKYETAITFPDKSMDKMSFLIFMSIFSNHTPHITILLFSSNIYNLFYNMDYFTISGSSV